MTLRLLVIAVLALVLASAAWRYRAWLTPDAPAPAPRPVVFDNDHATPPPPPASAAPGAATVRAPGALRKCVRGGEVSYTDRACPAGFREREVATDRVTVMPAAPVAATATSASRRTLKQQLDVADEDRLRERMIDRAVEGATR